MRQSRVVLKLIAALLGLAGLVALGLYLYSLPYTLRIAAGPAASANQRLLAAVQQVVGEESTRFQFQRVATNGPAASAKALEDGEADLAIVRSDLAMPAIGETIAIVGRESLVLLVPAYSDIDRFTAVNGKTIGFLEGGDDVRLFDALLAAYKIPADRVVHLSLSPDDMANAIRQKRVAAIFALDQPEKGLLKELVRTIIKATKKEPALIGFDDAEVVTKRLPYLEEAEIPQAAFNLAPPVPDESTATVSITYRLIARKSLPNFAARQIARLLFVTKQKMLAVTPLAAQIEAPDTDASSLFHVHPGAKAYYDGEQTSVADMAGNVLYLGGTLVGVLGSLFAWGLSRWRRMKQPESEDSIDSLAAIFRDLRGADAGELDVLEDRLDAMITGLLERRSKGEIDDGDFNSTSTILSLARDALERRRTFLAVSAKQG